MCGLSDASNKGESKKKITSRFKRCLMGEKKIATNRKLRVTHTVGKEISICAKVEGEKGSTSYDTWTPGSRMSLEAER